VPVIAAGWCRAGVGALRIWGTRSSLDAPVPVNTAGGAYEDEPNWAQPEHRRPRGRSTGGSSNGYLVLAAVFALIVVHVATWPVVPVTKDPRVGTFDEQHWGFSISGIMSAQHHLFWQWITAWGCAWAAPSRPWPG